MKIEKETNGAIQHCDITKLWDAVDNGNEWAEMVIIDIYTGFRISELLEIKKVDVNLEKRIMIGGGTKTAYGLDRRVPIHKCILPLIEKRMQGDSEWLFNKDGRNISPSEFKGIFLRLLKELGMDGYIVHAMRHTFITISKMQIDDIVLAHIVGHGRYKFSDEVLVEEIDKLPGRAELISE